MPKNIVKASSVEELRKIPGYPSNSRFAKGIVAVLECEEEIPCNPCEDACPRKAIRIGTPITNLPVLNEELCIGCGICVAGCPGQAIFMVDKTYSEKEDLVGIPYEFLPVPKIGDLVKVANRNGEILGTGKVVKILDTKKNNKTKLIYIAVQKGYGEEARAIVVEK